jgi:hypothetical protein
MCLSRPSPTGRVLQLGGETGKGQEAAGSVEEAVEAMRARHPGSAGPHLNPSAVKHALKGLHGSGQARCACRDSHTGSRARSGGVARVMFKQKVSLLRLSADPGGRLGGDKAHSQGKGGGRSSDVTPLLKAGQPKLAPTNRARLSTQPHRPAAGHVPSRDGSRVPPKAGTADITYSTPEKGKGRPLAAK